MIAGVGVWLYRLRTPHPRCFLHPPEPISDQPPTAIVKIKLETIQVLDDRRARENRGRGEEPYETDAGGTNRRKKKEGKDVRNLLRS
jgi:hypothetical protein